MLTERQKGLLEFLRENDDIYLSQYAISRALPWLYFFDGEMQKFHDSTARQYITADIREINADTAVPAIILSNSKGVKIATKEEFEQGMKAEFAAIFRRLKRAYEKAKKGANSGQLEFDRDLKVNEYTVFKYFFERGAEIDEKSKNQ